MQINYTLVSILKMAAFILLSTIISKPSVAQIPGCHAGFSFTVSGNTVFFTDTSFFDVGPQSTTWSWDFGDGNTDTTQHPVHTFSIPPNVYIICLTVTNCSIFSGLCCTDTYCDTIHIGKPTGLENINVVVSNLTVFPTPINQNFSLGFSLVYPGNITIEITHAAGKICHVTNLHKLMPGNQLINFAGTKLPSNGIYFISVLSDGKRNSAKAVIKL